MELLASFADIVLHLDRHLQWLVANYGPWIYAILFAIVFCETGLVVTPFLPGDSLLFAVGALAARPDGLNIWILLSTLTVAAILGDSVNYWIGKMFGNKLPQKFPRLIKPQHLQKTHDFYERYGGKTIIIARFVPIIRTFAPFVAGVGHMRYPRFLFFSFTGSIAWVGSLAYAGYYFGNVPMVRENLTLVILAIVLISIMPGIIEYLRHHSRSQQTK